jgi:phosphoribosylformylglycinamidine synthase PurS subunit
MFNAMKVTVTVMPKQSVLDPQGVAVRDAIHHHGMPQVKNVRIGKFLELEIDGTASQVQENLHEICRNFLSNPVIEDYQLSIES